MLDPVLEELLLDEAKSGCEVDVDWTRVEGPPKEVASDDDDELDMFLLSFMVEISENPTSGVSAVTTFLQLSSLRILEREPR